METTKQLTVHLENKPGRLANLLNALAREKVNLAAMAVMDTHERGALRIIPDDLTKARQVLKDHDLRFNEVDVLRVELRNHPGALAHVCEVLGVEHINIDYAYCSSGGRNGKVYGFFKVSNNEKALRVLGESPNSARRRMGRRPIHTRSGQPSSI